MSITVIFTVLKFIKKNWGAFLVIALATALFIATFYFRFYITRIEYKLKDIIEENQNLIATNMFFQDEIKQANTTIERLSIYSNSLSKIKMSTNFYIPKETAMAILDINFDFYSNRQKNEGQTGLDFDLIQLTNRGQTNESIISNNL